MRFEQQISAGLRVVVSGVVGLCLFASGRPLSASEQNPTAVLQPPRAAPPVASEIQISSDEAVRMALENNLAIRAERLSPQLQALALSQTRATYVPNVISAFSKGSSTNPPEDFLSGNAATLTAGGIRTNGGVQQFLKWGGGRYQVTLDGARNRTNNPSSTYNPKLSSNFNFNYTQPLLRNFLIDSTRQQLLVGQKEQEIVDLQLKQQVTQTSRAVRSAYYDLVGAIGQLDVANRSLGLANQSLKNNERRVEVGALAQIDIVEAQAEVSRQEESVILAEAQIRSAEDNLRTLIMNPSQPDFWTTRITPSEQPVANERPINLDAAIQNALANRTDLAQARRQMEQTDIGMKYIKNQKLPAVDMVAGYGLVGLGGTQSEFDYDAGVFPYPIKSQTQRSFGDALRDVFGNNFKTWSVVFNVSYPIGRSQADAALAQSRLQREQQVTNLRALEVQVTGSVREAARQVETSLKRVEATRKARDFAQKRYEAEEKRMTVGLSTTFQLFQAQRDLASQKLAELNAIIAYSRALVNFEAVQLVPVGGR